jgi:predicted transcriptional regulator
MSSPRPPFLGDLELAVMDHLWSRGGQDAKQVHRAIGRGRRITLNTIQSTLKRLFEKGLLDREKVSHAHVYSPCITRADFHRGALQEVVDRLMGGRSDAMLSAFIGVAEQVGQEQLEQLEKLVADRLKSYRDGEES